MINQFIASCCCCCCNQTKIYRRTEQKLAYISMNMLNQHYTLCVVISLPATSVKIECWSYSQHSNNKNGRYNWCWLLLPPSLFNTICVVCLANMFVTNRFRSIVCVFMCVCVCVWVRIRVSYAHTTCVYVGLRCTFVELLIEEQLTRFLQFWNSLQLFTLFGRFFIFFGILNFCLGSIF